MKIEKTSKTVNSAIDEVLKEYNLSFSDIEYEIIQEPFKGFLGFGRKLAKVIFTIKKDEEGQKDENIFDFFEKTEQISQNSTLEKDEIEKTDEDQEVIEKTKKFLTEIFDAMDLKIEIKAKFTKKNTLFIQLDGENIGVVIGKRGQTLDSLQYITNLAVNKGSESYINIEMDTLNYREQRKQALELLALNLVKKVKKTNKMVKLEPMNSYERKIIHNTLKFNEDVKTFSEGNDPFRYVVIVPKLKKF